MCKGGPSAKTHRMAAKGSFVGRDTVADKSGGIDPDRGSLTDAAGESIQDGDEVAVSWTSTPEPDL